MIGLDITNNNITTVMTLDGIRGCDDVTFFKGFSTSIWIGWHLMTIGFVNVIFERRLGENSQERN